MRSPQSAAPRPSVLARRLALIRVYFDTHGPLPDSERPDAVDWARIVPLALAHLALFAVFWVGWSPLAVALAGLAYLVRMFGITAGYHRYFAHRSFKTSRVGQLALAVLGASAGQRGPLWWAAHHRIHHRASDQAEDPHSPRHGFWRSHLLWLTTRRHFNTRMEFVQDLAGYPELRFLDRFDTLVLLVYLLGCLGLGFALEGWAPELATSASQVLVWVGFVSTLALLHGTCAINSFGHIFGSRRYETRDDSRNNALLAVLTLGEGWHNNHHRFPKLIRQGHRWWELDLTWMMLCALSRLGIVWGIRPQPRAVNEAG